MSAEGVVAAHLRALEMRNRRPGTIRQRGYALRRLERSVGDVLRASPRALREHLERPSLGAAARATELSHLRGFYKWALEEDHVVRDPTQRIVRPSTPRRLPRPMPDGDLAVALEMAPERVRPWLFLAAYCGLRACEIAQLRGEDLLLDHEPPVLLIAEGKGGGMSSVPVAAWLVDELAGLPRHGWVFRRRDGQPGPVPAHLVSHLANDFLHSLGITHTLHTLRHWFGTNAYRASGRDVRATQELLRHRSPVSTAIYTYVDPGELADTVERLPRFSSQPTLW